MSGGSSSSKSCKRTHSRKVSTATGAGTGASRKGQGRPSLRGCRPARWRLTSPEGPPSLPSTLRLKLRSRWRRFWNHTCTCVRGGGRAEHNHGGRARGCLNEPLRRVQASPMDRAQPMPGGGSIPRCTHPHTHPARRKLPRSSGRHTPSPSREPQRELRWPHGQAAGRGSSVTTRHAREGAALRPLPPQPHTQPHRALAEPLSAQPPQQRRRRPGWGGRRRAWRAVTARS